VTSFTEQRTEVLRLAERVAALARARGASELGDAVDQSASGLRDERLSVTAVGEFKRGKSSLLNALLEEPGLFPVDTSIATNVVTTVGYGDPERVTVLDGDGREREISRDQIRDYATELENPGNEQDVRIVTIELPNARLRSGLLLVDTPGVGGLNRAHTAITYGFLTAADVVLFVLDALTPLSTEELEFLRSVREHCHSILVVVTKIDKVSGYETIVENSRAKVASALERPAEEIVIVPVSSWAKLEHLRTGDPEDLEVSNFEALERELWGHLRERGGALLLLRPLGVLTRAVDMLIQPMSAEMAAYGERTEEELNRMEQEYAEATKRHEDLRQGQADWRKSLQRRLRAVRLDMTDAVQAVSIRTRRALDSGLDDPELLDDPEQLVGRLERDMTLAGAALAEQLRTKLDDVAQATAAETGLELNPAAPDVKIAAEAGAPEIEGVARTGVRGHAVLRSVQSGMMGASAGSLLGYIAAGLLISNPVTAGLLVVGAGAAGGVQLFRQQWRDQRERSQTVRRGSLKKQLQPYVEDSLHQMDARLKRALARAEETIADELDQRLRDEHERLVTSAAAIREARGRTHEEGTRRAAELKEPLEELTAIRERVRDQADAAVAATRRPTAPQPAATAAASGGDRGEWAED
jgi:predicted GTPase